MKQAEKRKYPESDYNPQAAKKSRGTLETIPWECGEQELPPPGGRVGAWV